jgi:uncharacterized protein (UPF0335 family)
MTEAATSDGQPRPNSGGGDLRRFIERAERVNDEIEQARDDFKELMLEAKSAGYNPAAIRKVLKLRNEKPEQKAKRQSLESDVDVYLSSLGIMD